ncbi:hypothetical protein EGW08_012742 [Elysia chlorotica]|uniref:Uncharacterized protein n=1 Tax=Elysia chlorotica TaxID=188477 RepID=A0A3S0ZK26_ELYCH|nr:hypothetical protein EGW08_012742 [Elysia chlorotica]
MGDLNLSPQHPRRGHLLTSGKSITFTDRGDKYTATFWANPACTNFAKANVSLVQNIGGEINCTVHIWVNEHRVATSVCDLRNVARGVVWVRVTKGSGRNAPANIEVSQGTDSEINPPFILGVERILAHVRIDVDATNTANTADAEESSCNIL